MIIRNNREAEEDVIVCAFFFILANIVLAIGYAIMAETQFGCQTAYKLGIKPINPPHCEVRHD